MGLDILGGQGCGGSLERSAKGFWGPWRVPERWGSLEGSQGSGESQEVSRGSGRSFGCLWWGSGIWGTPEGFWGP